MYGVRAPAGRAAGHAGGVVSGARGPRLRNATALEHEAETCDRMAEEFHMHDDDRLSALYRDKAQSLRELAAGARDAARWPDETEREW
jgi:hypothetical protein